MTGAEATLFRYRLAQAGFEVRQFHYRSMTTDVATVLAELRAEIASMDGPVHLVGHSLGGLVMLRLLTEDPDLPVGRVVLLGSPVNGSRSARAFARLPGASFLFGAFAAEELLADLERPRAHRAEIGVIAGSHSLGFGRLLGNLPVPNDGTVAVVETELEGATDHRVLPVSHTGLLVSEEVVQATACFLRQGRFPAATP
jgi:pimeloyl-ACP methyl ester carboxylesterase